MDRLPTTFRKQKKVARIHSRKKSGKVLLGNIPDQWMKHCVDHIHMSSSHTFAHILPLLFYWIYLYVNIQQGDIGLMTVEIPQQLKHSSRLNPNTYLNSKPEGDVNVTLA